MSKHNKTLVVGLLSAVFIYCLLGFLLLPGIALHLVNNQLEQRLTEPARVDRLEFNPFTLELTLGDLIIGQSDNPVVSVRQLSANLQLSSLWRGALELDSLVIDQPQISAVLQESGSLNLAGLIDTSIDSTEQEPQAAAEGENGDLFPLRIARLALTDGQLHFQDLQPANAVQARFEGIELQAQPFSTLRGEPTGLELQAQGPTNAQLALQGELFVAPLSGTGTLSIDELPLSSFWPYVRERLDLNPEGGTLSTGFDYRFDLANGTELVLDNASATLSALSLETPGKEPLARLAQLQVEDASLNLANRSARIGTLRSRQLEAWISRETDGRLNWQAVLPAQQQTESGQEQDSTDPAWRILLPDVQLRDYQLHLADRQPEKAVELELRALDLNIGGFDSGSGDPFQLRLETQLGSDGHLAAEGQASLDPPSVDLQATAENIDLRLAQTYLEPLVRVQIRDGRLDATARIQFAATQPPELSVEADASISAMHVIDSIQERDLVRWERLKLDGITYRDNSLSIERAGLLAPFARIIINQDLSTNLGNLVVERPAAENNDEAPLAMRIGAVDIDQGSINFADFSLQPNVALTIEEVNGRLGTLDNRSTQPAELTLTGQVDRYAPVSVEGSFTPFDPLNSLDVEASFKDIELTTLSPYALKFAGYRIRKGRLDLSLHYRINGGDLEAENQVLLRDLQLGERVESPSAVDLPVRLAVALLKDGQGNISISLPVQGNLNNPEFDIMPVIWQSFGNLLSRAATAPFRFLGNLFANEKDDLSQILFAPGEATLSGQARQRLDNLATALRERPALRLEVEAMSSPQLDGPLVAQQRLDRELARRWRKRLEQEQVGAPAAQDGIPMQARTELLTVLYQERLKQPVPPEWTELEDQARLERIRQAVQETWQDSDALLRRLAQERSASIKAYLVDDAALTASRVQLLDVGIDAAGADAEVPTTLHLGVE